jgi:hypothetical protein
MRAFHGTSVKNVGSIMEKGLLAKYDGVYLTDSEESALRWTGFRLRAMGESKIAVVEVEVDEKDLEEGVDHSPMMVQMFGVGKSLVSLESIPPEKIINVNLYEFG